MSFDYLGQAVHTTGPLGVECVFHDYVNFVVGTDPADGLTTLVAFSISQQAGSLGDDGQVFENLIIIILRITIIIIIIIILIITIIIITQNIIFLMPCLCQPIHSLFSPTFDTELLQHYHCCFSNQVRQ